ncbi:hypothetical protein ACXYMX_08695 [Sporosarcina sp. CAU 1771]
MSKWTIYQLVTVFVFSMLVLLKNIYSERLSIVLIFVDRWIEPSVLILFFTVLLIIWGTAFILLVQERKEKPLFVHKVWKVMPAIMGAVLLISFFVAVLLFITILSDINESLFWMLDLSIVYFLVVYYFFILSIIIRYGKIKTSRGIIRTSANTSVLILIIGILFIPMILV